MLIPLFTWSAVHAILAAILLFGGSAFWVLYHIHNRLTALEETTGERNAVIFGEDNNPLHVGLIKEVSQLKNRIDSTESRLDNAKRERDELEGRIIELEERLDELEDDE